MPLAAGYPHRWNKSHFWPHYFLENLCPFRVLGDEMMINYRLLSSILLPILTFLEDQGWGQGQSCFPSSLYFKTHIFGFLFVCFPVVFYLPVCFVFINSHSFRHWPQGMLIFSFVFFCYHKLEWKVSIFKFTTKNETTKMFYFHASYQSCRLLCMESFYNVKHVWYSFKVNYYKYSMLQYLYFIPICIVSHPNLISISSVRFLQDMFCLEVLQKYSFPFYWWGTFLCQKS